MKIQMVWWKLLIVIITAFSSLARTSYKSKDGVPSWLDTVPPKVKIEPRKLYHNSIFYISLSCNEPANIWIAINQPDSFALRPYRKPIEVSQDTKLSVYFYAEDLVGNKSPLDSMKYILDTRAPELKVKPHPGRFRNPVVVRAFANEPCSFFYYHRNDSTRVYFSDSFVVKQSFDGIIAAVDSAGNITRSNRLNYIVDTSVVHVKISPTPGVYNIQHDITFSIEPAGDIYFSLDPLKPPQWFEKYQRPIQLPIGLTIVRYYGKDGYGWESELLQASFMVDTTPPKIRLEHKEGILFDTLFISTKEKAIIRYTTDGSNPNDESRSYEKFILVPRKGKANIKLRAQDVAGNYSDITNWEQKYDFQPPQLTLSKGTGVYREAIKLKIYSDEPAAIYYTLDGTTPTTRSIMFTDSMLISKEGRTILKCFGIDEAGNQSPVLTAEFTIDSRPPVIKEKIETNTTEEVFVVSLKADEPATIYYEIGEIQPSLSSNVYKEPIRMRANEVLRYFAIDGASNRSAIFVMDELKKPMVLASPPGGLFNKRVPITFTVTLGASVYYHILPDTSWILYSDTLLLAKEGTYVLEYYCQTRAEIRSPIKRAEYCIDLSAPYVEINTRKIEDSIIVFFNANEKASIYYTLDGSNPHFSSTTKTAANKFLSSSDRITIFKPSFVTLSYFAEDAAGNQSRVRVVDITKPRVIPSIPSGPELLYNQVLSLSLNSFEKSQIFYSRHGASPTEDSSMFIAPITIATSDTIIAFAVDVSGFKGEPDTFIYLIDLPPSPQFSIRPDSAIVGTSLTFDASASIDHETPTNQLLYRWDFDGDGTFDTKEIRLPIVQYNYRKPGLYRPSLEVTDSRGQKQTVSAAILVRISCPSDMLAVPLENNRTFCIDRYEYGNTKGQIPKTSVSWVEAKMLCREIGKRLCTQEEWIRACRGYYDRAYPYGSIYEDRKCNTAGKKPSSCGNFKGCVGDFGVYDMVGNVWEWTETKLDGYPVAMGGTFNSGGVAHCGHMSFGTVGLKYSDVGFRCCK